MRKLVVAVIASLAVFAGCTPEVAPTPTASPTTTEPSTPGTPSPTGSAAEVPLGTRYDLPAERDTAQWGEPLASKVGKKAAARTTLSREGWRVDLMGVYRLAGDRVLAEFRLNADDAVRPDMQVWQDPRYDSWFHKADRDNGGYLGTVWEFSDVRLGVAGDDTSYRPVRTKTSFCLCSMTADYVKGYGDFAAYVVLSTPKDATTVNLAVRDVGTFSDVAVTSEPPTRTVVPLGYGYQLRLQSVTRPAEGLVRVRFSLELPATPVAGTTFRVRYLYQVQGASPWAKLLDTGAGFQNLIALDTGGEYGGWPKQSSKGTCTSCTRIQGYLSKAGTGVDAEIDLPDPGSQDVVVAGTVGWPFSVAAADGTPTASEVRVRYQHQEVTSGATIGNSDIDLDTAVLFHVNKATLTSTANATLDRVAKALQAQDGRTVSIVGHTDSTGSTGHNQGLSQRRAQAVKAALARRLGAGWTLTAQGRGESDPKVSEAGLSGSKLERARALNRRVEVSVK